jgi:hypothetical protein
MARKKTPDDAPEWVKRVEPDPPEGWPEFIESEEVDRRMMDEVRSNDRPALKLEKTVRKCQHRRLIGD